MSIKFYSFPVFFYDGIQLKSKGQQVSSGLQDSSKYPSRSYHCCGLHDFDISSDLHRSANEAIWCPWVATSCDA